MIIDLVEAFKRLVRYVSSRPLFFGVVIDQKERGPIAKVKVCSSPLLQGCYRSTGRIQEVKSFEGFSSPVLRGSYRIAKFMTVELKGIVFSSPLLRGCYRSTDETQELQVA